MKLDIHNVIMSAKLGRERKDAQVDTCAVFAAALFDVLQSHGISCRLETASPTSLGFPKWYHSVLKVGETYYDSMGEFSEEIYRSRAKIHPKVTVSMGYVPDTRSEIYEAEFDEIHAFFVKMLKKSVVKISLDSPTTEAISEEDIALKFGR